MMSDMVAHVCVLVSETVFDVWFFYVSSVFDFIAGLASRARDLNINEKSEKHVITVIPGRMKGLKSIDLKFDSYHLPVVTWPYYKFMFDVWSLLIAHPSIFPIFKLNALFVLHLNIFRFMNGTLFHVTSCRFVPLINAPSSIDPNHSLANMIQMHFID